MQQAWEFLKGKKTYLAAGITVLIVVAQHYGVQIPGVPQLNDTDAITAILAATIRHGVANA